VFCVEWIGDRKRFEAGRRSKVMRSSSRMLTMTMKSSGQDAGFGGGSAGSMESGL
jgi:hypothetical protein